MMMLKSLLALLVLGLCLADNAHILVQKTIVTKKVVVDQEIAVSYRLFNIGSATAHNIDLADDSFPASEFSPVVGLATASWEKLAPGGNLTHSLVLKPTKVGAYDSTPALVHYRHTPKGQPVEVTRSTTTGPVYVLKASEREKFTLTRLNEWIVFAVAAMVPVGVPLVGWLYIRLNYENGVAKAAAAQ